MSSNYSTPRIGMTDSPGMSDRQDFGSPQLQPAVNVQSPATVYEDSSIPPSPSLPYMPQYSPRPNNAYYHSPSMENEAGRDHVPPELGPVFSFLNVHSKKIFMEGYLLKLNDLLPDGRPSPDRRWTEYYGQLSGTVLSLWDAAALDQSAQAREQEEVVPLFLNVTDAMVRMIGTLPSRNSPPLQNIMSISTAGQNRYLFQFSSMQSLVQWTAGMKLALFEYASLQESYTGALIAGFGRSINNIRLILTESKLKMEGWVRVRFAPGTPWQKYWAVLTPPERKKKKKEAPGELSFYESKKTKKGPVAVVTDVFAAYAVYPQARALIENSSLIKMHGTIKRSDVFGEGFVFFMPDMSPMVRGLEVLLSWLVPFYDTFALYGRPRKFVSDPADPNSLFFAMPRERGHYGSLEVQDVMSLVASEQQKSERRWREDIRSLIVARMQRGRVRNSLPPQSKTLKWGDEEEETSSPPIPEPTAVSDYSHSGNNNSSSSSSSNNNNNNNNNTTGGRQRSISDGVKDRIRSGFGSNKFLSNLANRRSANGSREGLAGGGRVGSATSSRESVQSLAKSPPLPLPPLPRGPAHPVSRQPGAARPGSPLPLVGLGLHEHATPPPPPHKDLPTPPRPAAAPQQAFYQQGGSAASSGSRIASDNASRERISRQ